LLAVDHAIALLARTSIAGITLFLLPPTGETPPGWQIGAALPVWVAWSYWRGVLARRDLTAAIIEAIPSLWLSVMWAQLFVRAWAMHLSTVSAI
jgi:hypothetical protein